MTRYMFTEAPGSLAKNKPSPIEKEDDEVLIEFSKDLSIGLLPDHIISLIEKELQTTAPWMVSGCKTWMWHQTFCHRDADDDNSEVAEVQEPDWELDYDGYDSWNEWEEENGYGSDGFATQSKCDIRYNRMDNYDDDDDY